MSFRLVSLDMAGTTFDDGNTVYEVLEHTVTEASGQQVPGELLEKWTGTSKFAAIEGMLTALKSEADPREVYAQFTKALNDRYRDNPPQPFPGVAEMCAELRDEGVKVARRPGISGTKNRP